MREFLLGMWLAIALVASVPATRLMADGAPKDAKVEKKEDTKDSKTADAEKAAKEKQAKADAEAKVRKAREEKEAAEKKAAEEKQAADKAKPGDKDSKKDAKPESSKSSDKKDSKSESKKVRFAHIVIEGELPESPGEISLFGDLGVDLRKTLARLEKAGDDKAIVGVILQIDSVMGRGKVNELRAAVQRIQSKGKKVYALVESAIGPQYQLAAACDEIVMPESGEILVPGVRAEFTFFKDLLGKLGIEADMMHVGDYKGAAEPFTRDSLSEPVRKNMTALVDDLYDEMLTAIASDRDLKTEEVRKAVDHGLLMATEAKDAGLIDRIAYPDEFRNQLSKEYKTDNLVYVENYGKKKVDTDFSGPMGMVKLFQTILGEDSGKKSDSDAKVAVVYAVGPITTGKGESGPFGGSSVVGSTSLVKALKEAADDDTVKAIVLRVDSPGGSALASDLIWRETQAIEKPIVASMGDVAASGGYYISMGCDKIFAEPGTLTGSIGVVGGKMALKGLFDKIGLTTESIARGENSGMFSTTTKFSKGEREVVERMMKDVYGQFTAKAAKGRGMEKDALEKLAGGQVYTGRVAKRNGLVDEVGTLRDSIQAAKRLAGIDPDQKVEIKVLPEPKNPFEALFGANTNTEKETRTQLFGVLTSFAPELRSAVQHVMELRQVMREPVAVVMPYWVEIK